MNMEFWRLKNICTQCWRLALPFTLGFCWASLPVWARPIPVYADLQTFKGQAYFKDENIWIYTKEFAQTFRMPQEWASDKLAGIAAAAFRVQPAELDCGLARRADACRRNERCVMDVYIDEAKHPLPWSDDKTSDWLPISDSSGWLYRAEDGAPGWPYLPPGIERPAVRSLMPWLDQKTGKVAMYYEDSAYATDHGRTTQLLAYKRKLVGNMTMLSMHYRCLSRHKKPYTTFRLELRQGGSGTSVLKRYHEFLLPDEFEQRIDTLVEAHRRKDEAQFKQLLNVK